MIFVQVDETGGHLKTLVDEMQNTTRQAGREIRAEVESTIFFDFAGEINTGIFFLHGEFDVGIGFVIAQHDIEFGVVFLDEIVLEGQSFAFVADNDGFEVSDFAGQRAGFGVDPAGFQEIGADSAAKRGGFSDVENRTASVFEDVDARLFRESGGFFAGFHSN